MILNRLGETYSSNDVSVNLAGFRVDPSALSYTRTVTKTKQQGFSHQNNMMSRGAPEYACSITLPIQDVRIFEKLAPGGYVDLLKKLPLIVTYLNADNGLITDVLIVEFQSTGREVTTDGAQQQQYDLYVYSAVFNK